MQQLVVAILGRRWLRSSIRPHVIVKGYAAARQSLLRVPVLHVGASYLRARQSIPRSSRRLFERERLAVVIQVQQGLPDKFGQRRGGTQPTVSPAQPL